MEINKNKLKKLTIWKKCSQGKFLNLPSQNLLKKNKNSLSSLPPKKLSGGFSW
jgi:hypothetical protein